MSIFDTKLIDTSKSNLLIEGSTEKRLKYLKLINQHKENMLDDRKQRRQKLGKLRDFYYGDQESYTTVVGKRSKEKKGHANAVYNYAGKTVKKITMTMSNNPPVITFPGNKRVSDVMVERLRAQSVEDFVEETFNRNRFWKTGYVRGCLNQSMGSAAIKIYPINNGSAEEPEWDIRIVNHERMENLIIGWRGDDPTRYDFVISEEYRSKKSLEDEYGIKIPDKLVKDRTDKIKNNMNEGNSWSTGKLWDSKKGSGHPDGDNKEPGLLLTEYDDENYYCILIENQFIQFVEKDDVAFPKVGFWVFLNNIPAPKSPYGASDIDDLIDPQIEFNEANNDERDYIRVGAAQKFVAYNMDDFDPESIKTGSGGVIFVNSDDNSAKFEPLATNVNVFPIDSFLNRIQDIMYDLGLPKVTFGSGGADSGRSKAIDYQSMVDLLDFKRGQWELALNQISEKIQVLGAFFFEDIDFFSHPDTGAFTVRHPEFDWDDLVPVTKSDQIVNVLNKFQMGLPFRIVFKELGYKDPDAIIEEMKRENEDEDLMIMRSKMYQLTGGIIEASQRAQSQAQEMGQVPNPNQATPTLLPEQNSGNTQPMATKNGTQVSFSSPEGLIQQVGQNLAAQGR